MLIFRSDKIIKMKIVVASKNPVKINAVKLAFETFFESVFIEGVDVDSGVASQPKTDDETLRGALTRAENAKQNKSDADFWIGIEGGTQPDGNNLNAFAWVAIKTIEKTESARSATFRIPPKVQELINSGYELGHANDIVFKQNNSKQKGGAVGLLTHGRVTRTNLYQQAVQLALIPFINSDLY